MEELSKFMDEELQKFIDDELDRYSTWVNSVGSPSKEYTNATLKAIQNIKRYIEEKYSGIRVDDNILHNIRIDKEDCHRKFKDVMPFFIDNPDYRPGTKWGDGTLQRLEEKYKLNCEKLMDLIGISQKIDPNNIDENVFEELRQKGKLTENIGDFDNPKYVTRNIISFTNPLMQYAFDKYCENKAQVKEYENEIKERDAIISEDTQTIGKLADITEKCSKIMEDEKKALFDMRSRMTATKEYANKLGTTPEKETKKGLFTRIKEKLINHFLEPVDENLMLPEKAGFDEEFKPVKDEINNNIIQTFKREEIIFDEKESLRKNNSEIASMMHKRTSMLEKIHGIGKEKNKNKSKGESEQER